VFIEVSSDLEVVIQVSPVVLNANTPGETAVHVRVASWNPTLVLM
jgi:hypothetical protein